MEQKTVGEWIDTLAKDPAGDRAAFAARHPVHVLVTIEGEADGAVIGVDSTAMFDPSKHKAGSLASRDARVYRVVRRSAGSGEIVVGRAKDCDVWIADERVSKKHAAFEQVAAGYTLHDLGSKNGTYVNDRRLDKDERAHVKSGDSVRFGRAMKMHFLDAGGLYEYLNLLRRFGL